jgi:hypothetical protein
MLQCFFAVTGLCDDFLYAEYGEHIADLGLQPKKDQLDVTLPAGMQRGQQHTHSGRGYIPQLMAIDEQVRQFFTVDKACKGVICLYGGVCVKLSIQLNQSGFIKLLYLYNKNL